MRISIVIPALNEAGGIAATLGALQTLRAQGHELIVVDGGSEDDTIDHAAPLCDKLLTAPRGRARQMNAGARVASGDVLWFLHADTLAPPRAAGDLLTALSRPGCDWGRFDVRLSGRRPLLRVVEAAMNLRSRWSGIATGDQGLFVRRALFERLGGFPDIPLMEDVAFSRLLKQQGAPACLSTRLLTSSRRWEEYGMLRTVFLMWRLRFAYWRGVSPRQLHAWYRQS